MARDYRNSHDEYQRSDSDSGSGPWPGKRSPASMIPPPAGVVRAFGEVGDDAAPAAEALESKGAGSPLPASIATVARESYGDDVSDVRVHRNPEAAGKLGAQAFTHGSDVFVGDGIDSETDHGRFVMLHEVAHVVQGRGAQPETQKKLEVGKSDDPAEHEADHAAESALAGERTTIQRRVAGRVHRFGAGSVKINPKAKPDENKFVVKEGGHADMTVQALKEMGLSHDQAAEGYQGNWMRDLSQAMVPGLVGKLKADNLLAILQIMSINEFGKGFDEKEFGTYDPVEHMDNPTDLRASDVFQQYERGPDGYPKGVDPNMTIPVFGVQLGKSEDPTKPMDTAGNENQAYGDVDKRYDATKANMEKNGQKVINTGDAVPFQVGSGGIPVYMNTSKEWCKATLHDSAMIGRDDPKGPRQFGSAIHVMQDYYAHSNFCEIAINSLIKSGKLVIPDDESGKTSSAIDKSARLDSKVHKNDPKTGEPIKSVNLKVKDLPGFKGKPSEGDREVMATGSFNLTDTAVSLLHVVKEKLNALNPFKEKGKGPSPLVNACLDYIDMTKPDKFNKTGERIAGIIRPLADAVDAVGGTIASGVSKAGEVGKGATDGIFDGMNKVNAFFGGDADYWDSNKKSVGSAITGETEAAAKKIKEVSGWLTKKADEIQNKEHILRDVYGWASGIDLLAPVKALARAIPIVGEKVAELIEKAQKKIKELAEEILDDLWAAAVKVIIGKIQGVIDWLTAKTNIKDKKKAGKAGQTAGPDWLPNKVREMLGDKKAEVEKMLGGVGDMYDDKGKPTNGIAPGSYTPPSHSEVAKDHHAEDGAVDPGKKAEGGDHHDDHDDHDEHGEHGEAHAHGSDWMNSIAEKLALMASKGIGAKVSAAWDERKNGPLPKNYLDDIDGAVDKYFAHPDDCDYWQSAVTGFCQTPAVAHRLREELKKNK